MSRQPVDMKGRIAENIERAIGDLTNAEVARRMGKDSREIRRWRRGEVTPNEENLAALGYALDVRDLTWFYLPHEERKAA